MSTTTHTASQPLTFEQYQPRRIAFHQLVEIEGWFVKIYTITNRPQFASSETLEAAITALPLCLSIPKTSDLPVYNVAFLIVHEAREGAWLLFSWWTGGEMLETEVYFASRAMPDHIQPSPHDGTLMCVWEMEVLWHERKAWIKHVLSQPDHPALLAYINDVFPS